MSPVKAAVTTTEIYDQALKYARDFRLPPDAPQPKFTAEWLPENVATLQRYRKWLSSGGNSEQVIRCLHIPMAGHILSLNNLPSSELDLEQDLEKALQYIRAKQLSASWTHNCYLAMLKFRCFLLNERGLLETQITPYDHTEHTQGLPEWLVTALLRYQHCKQVNWRNARLHENIRRFWSGHLRTWRYFVNEHQVTELSHLKRSMVLDYTDFRLQQKAAVSGINGDLRSLRAFLYFLQEQGHTVPYSLTRIPCLKEPDPLPKFLTDAQVRKLQEDFEARVLQAGDFKAKRNALLDRASFYLLWQSAMRIGEVEELRLEDLDLDQRRLYVRRGKGLKDHTVFCSETTVNALRAYLEVRGEGPTDHVFLFRNQPVEKDLIRGRIKAAGERVGVHVYPHRLRHTCATQLLNAGCRITSIQKFLGHKRLNTTLTYARVHDETVASDYFAAMQIVEKRIGLSLNLQKGGCTLSAIQHQRLLLLAEQLKAPELETSTRLSLVEQMCALLEGQSETPLLLDLPVEVVTI